MNTIKVRVSGNYLARRFKGGALDIVFIINYSECQLVYESGTDSELDVEDFHWIADKPLDLDDVMRVHLSGGSDKMIEGIISTYLDCFS